MFRFPRALSALMLLLVLEPSCMRKRVALPLPPPPASSPEENRPSTANPGTSPSPASSATPAKEDPRYQVNRPPQPGEPLPQPAQPPRRSSRPGEPNGATTTNQPPATPAPRLGDILTPEQEQQYNAAIDQSLGRAQNNLGSVSSRKLTKEQQAVVAQIQNFVQQAQSTRKSNLPAARSLAERADVLARDLVRSLR